MRAPSCRPFERPRQPDYAEALNNRGNALQELTRPDEALASYDKALALKPDYAEALNNRGNALQELQERVVVDMCAGRGRVEHDPDVLVVGQPAQALDPFMGDWHVEARRALETVRVRIDADHCAHFEVLRRSAVKIDQDRRKTVMRLKARRSWCKIQDICTSVLTPKAEGF